MTVSSADPARARVDRPWGWYQTVSESPGSLVKRIRVAAGQQISLQKHVHRAEHWVVVEGTAHVTVGNRVMDLQPGQHVDIAVGVVHRLATLIEAHALDLAVLATAEPARLSPAALALTRAMRALSSRLI